MTQNDKSEVIETVADLLDSFGVLRFRLEEYSGTLEEYLRCLWMLINSHKSEEVSLTLIRRLLLDAIDLKPLPFIEEWRQYTSPPLHEDVTNDFNYLDQTILYQIADLHRLYERGSYQDDIRKLGRGIAVESPTGSRWYNLHPQDYFEAGVAGYRAHCESFAVPEPTEWTKLGLQRIGQPLDAKTFTWADLAEILRLGQIYE